MRYLTILLFLFSFTFVAQGQSTLQTQTLKHEFEDNTIYLNIMSVEDQQFVEVWRVGDNGQCSMYPSSANLKENSIEFPAGTVWKLDYLGENIRIDFPNGESVIYSPTNEDPYIKCGIKGQQV